MAKNMQNQPAQPVNAKCKEICKEIVNFACKATQNVQKRPRRVRSPQKQYLNRSPLMNTDCLAIEFILDFREKGNVNIPALLHAVRICPSKVMLNEESHKSVVLLWWYTASKDRSAWDVPNTVLRYVFDFRLQEIMKQPFVCWCYYTGNAASVFQFGVPFLLYCNATKHKSLAKFGDKAYLFNSDEYVSENDVLVFLLKKNYALVRDLYKRLSRSANGAAYTGIFTSLYREICAQETALLHRGILEKYADIKIRSMLLKLREKFWKNGSDEP